jgi:hypothetical protein
MRVILKHTICIVIFATIVYLICQLLKPKKMKPLYMKKSMSSAELNANALENNNAFLNADEFTNDNAYRSQHELPLVDRLPLVVENTLIRPANEIVPMNYKDCSCKDEVEKELYTNDAPLFLDKGPTNLVPLDLNDSTHRRVNFY